MDETAGMEAGRKADADRITDTTGMTSADPVTGSDPVTGAGRERSGDRVPWAVWVIAAVFIAVELAVSGRYGFLQDELYFIVAGHHLAFGYVDQPPLAPLLTRVTAVLGVSPTAIRIAPALAGGVVVVLTARLAALFGAGRFGRVLAALAAACAPVVLALAHLGITEPFDLLAWTIVLLCVCTALLRDRPRWWLGAGVAAGLGLEDNNLMALLLIGLLAGLLLTGRRRVLRAPWPWLGAGLAALIWLPNAAWLATHQWSELTMASSLHQDNNSVAAYITSLPVQLAFAGLFVIPLVIAGAVRFWRTPELRFLAVTVTLIAVFVALWVPGKQYYAEGTGPAVLAAGCAAAEGWMARGHRAGLRRGLLIAAPLISMAITILTILPIVPVADLHKVPGVDQITTADTVGWPQLVATVASQDAALTRAGGAPTAIFTENYAEAAALDVLGGGDHLPPVLSGHNTFWLWGPGAASDRTVLVVDALDAVQPYFSDCRVLTTWNAPDQAPSNFSGLQIAVCSEPMASWQAIWPNLKHYD
jgi:Dolichyl-phosphate-mannose-protein mannosyltransferase